MKFTKEVPKTTGERIRDYLKDRDTSKTKTVINKTTVAVTLGKALVMGAGMLLNHDIAKKKVDIKKK